MATSILSRSPINAYSMQYSPFTTNSMNYCSDYQRSQDDKYPTSFSNHTNKMNNNNQTFENGYCYVENPSPQTFTSLQLPNIKQEPQANSNKTTPDYLPSFFTKPCNSSPPSSSSIYCSSMIQLSSPSLKYQTNMDHNEYSENDVQPSPETILKHLSDYRSNPSSKINLPNSYCLDSHNLKVENIMDGEVINMGDISKTPYEKIIHRPRRVRKCRVVRGRNQRICNWCGTTDTPEWRFGPNHCMLCNACGLQFRNKMKEEAKSKKKNAVSNLLN